MENESRPVQPIETVSEGWRLIGNDYWLFFGMTLVTTIMVIAVSAVIGGVVDLVATMVSRGIGAVSAGTSASAAEILIPQLVEQGFGTITTLAATLLSALLTCGIYIAFSRKASGGKPEFGDLFAGFKFFVPCLIIALIFTLLQFVVGVTSVIIWFALGISGMGAGILTPDGRFDPKIFLALIPAFLIIALLYLIYSFVVGALTFFTYQLIAIRKLSAIEAITQSVRAGARNFFGIVGLFIIEVLMAIGGALLCGIGIFFVIPILMATNFAAYLRVFGGPQNSAQNLPPPPPLFGEQPSSYS